MPGMGMNPANMSQGMFGGFGGQGMGMNNMNMGMGFDGGYTNGWVGQQMTGGDFGNAGFYPGGGYNQQSHQGQFSNQLNQMNAHQQQIPNNYQNAYAQGRDFRRGSQQGQVEEAGQGNDPDQVLNQDQAEPGDTSVDDPVSQQATDMPNQSTDDQPEEAGADAPSAPDGTKRSQDQLESGTDSTVPGEMPPSDKQTDHPETNENDAMEAGPTPGQNPIQSFQSQPSNNGDSYAQGPMVNANSFGAGIGGGVASGYGQMEPYGQQQFQPGMHGYMPRGRGYGRGGYGRGGFDNRRGGFHGPAYGSEFKVVTPQEPMGQGVVGAPTGPKAMREGNVRGRGGFGNMQRGGFTAGPVATPSVDSRGRRYVRQLRP
jgi:zinc finger CCCH domain-containing protein 13